MRVAILVPRREGIADRDALWQFCRPWWSGSFPDWPIYEGHHYTGLFNRSAAVNRAAELAGDWDVAVIIDSDVLADPNDVSVGAQLAHDLGCLVVPFSQRHNLTPFGTRRILQGDRGSWSRYIGRTFTDQHSAVICVPRRLWEAVGGFDEGFRGWGLEDTAFAIACEVMAGRPLERIEGELWHLHHAAAAGEKHGSPSHRANMARAAIYRAAWTEGDKETVTRMVREGRELAQAVTVDTIPRILHRVVPESTPDQAEAWWLAFGKLHPGWRLMTHRDPLDPAEWPMTSPHWADVSCGAQLADLVRLEALYRWGGVYVDMDVQPFRPFDPLMSAEVFAAWEDERVIPNAILGARPEHPLIRQCLTECIKHMKRSVWEAGPGVTTRVLGKAREALILPPGTFYDVHYRDPDRDTKMAAKPAPWTIARHHYWGSWLPEERRRVPEVAA